MEFSRVCLGNEEEKPVRAGWGRCECASWSRIIPLFMRGLEMVPWNIPRPPNPREFIKRIQCDASRLRAEGSRSSVGC